MKRMIILFICILLLTTGCVSGNFLEDNFESRELTEDIAKIIVHSYNSAPPTSLDFSETEQILYERAFLYFEYSGFYTKDGQFRDELSQYLQGDKYFLPADIVDTYLISKFNTQVNHDAISVYDSKNDQYVVQPGKAYQGEITVDSVANLGDQRFQIIATVKDEPKTSLFSILQTFTVEYDGEFKILSFQQQPKPFQKLSAEEQMLVSYIEDYYLSFKPKPFNSKHKLTYDEVFSHYLVFGLWDENGDVRSDLRQYATKGLYDAYHIPASIVDEYLTARFDTVVDHALIDCYDTENHYYAIIPEVVDGHDFAELIDYEKKGNIYTVTVKARNWLAPQQEQTQKFQLEISDNICKYLSLSIL